jgi:hypothetical protein
VRQAALTFARAIVDHAPDSPERNASIDAVDLAMMQANAAIAREMPRAMQAECGQAMAARDPRASFPDSRS